MSAGRLTLTLWLLLALGCAAPAAAAPGDLDPTFGTYGKFLEPPDHNTTADSLQVRPDGEILVGGRSWAPAAGGLAYRATVFAFTADGQPDLSFGQDGRVVLPATYGDASIALQGDKVVVAAIDLQYRVGVYRLNADGSLDASFGSGGLADTGLSAGNEVTPKIAAGSDGKIAVASSSGPIPGLIVARLLPNGQSFDPNFAGGVVYLTTPSKLSPQVVVAGPGDEVTVLSGGYTATSRMLRFAADGNLDQEFGSGGEATVAPDGSGYVTDMALRPDGSSVVVGFLRSGVTGYVAALTPSGHPDASFAHDGATETPDSVSVLYGVGIDSEGRIVATGWGSKLRLVRYLPDGTLDSTFGTNGVASGRFGHAHTEGRKLGFAPDGRILVAAQRVTGFRSDFLVLGLMRFLIASGPRDPDGDGVVGSRDRCPELVGEAPHGCPLVDRTIDLDGGKRGVKGQIEAAGRCLVIDQVGLLSPRRGRDALLKRVPVKYAGTFRARFAARFHGRVYARVHRHIGRNVGLCAGARSNTVKVG